MGLVSLEEDIFSLSIPLSLSTTPFSLPCSYTEERPCNHTVRKWFLSVSQEAGKQAPTGAESCWRLHLGLPRLQNCEKQSLLFKAPSLWCFVKTAQAD